MQFLATLFIKAKVALATASAVALVLFGAYALGGRSARKAVQIKQAADENKRLKSTVEAKSENEQAINRQSDDSINVELSTDWMRGD